MLGDPVWCTHFFAFFVTPSFQRSLGLSRPPALMGSALRTFFVGLLSSCYREHYGFISGIYLLRGQPHIFFSQTSTVTIHQFLSMFKFLIHKSGFRKGGCHMLFLFLRLRRYFERSKQYLYAEIIVRLIFVLPSKSTYCVLLFFYSIIV